MDTETLKLRFNKDGNFDVIWAVAPDMCVMGNIHLDSCDTWIFTRTIDTLTKPQENYIQNILSTLNR